MVLLFGLMLTYSFGIVTPALAEASSCGTGVEKVKWLEQATGIKDGLIIPCECLVGKQIITDVAGNVIKVTCGLNEVLQTVINFTQLILALTGTTALLMFVYGGVMFILAGGNQDRVGKGKEILKAATIGIILIFTSWLIINFVIYTATGGKVGLDQIQNLLK